MIASPYMLAGSQIYDLYQGHLDEDEDPISAATFLAERCRIKSLHNEIISLKAKKVQLLHQKKKEDAIASGKKARFLLLKSRRMGFTTWEQALSYMAVVSVPNSTCVTLADTQKNTKTIFRMVNLMARLDPQLQHKTSPSKVSLEIPSMNSIFHIGTAGSHSFSRGDNIYRAHGSEVAWWQGDIETIANLLAGITEAARHGEVILETTGNGAQGWFYETFKEAVAGDNHWTDLFYPWFLDPENVIIPTFEQEIEFRDTVTQEDLEIMKHYDLTIPQMLWRADKKIELKKLFPQEYPETWVEAFLVRGLSFFDQGVIGDLILHMKKPMHKREHIQIWVRPEAGVEYCAGADTAEGNADSDNCVCGILNKKTGEQVAVLRGRWRPEVFARKAIKLCKYYNDALFACEINNHGHSVMNTVMNTLGYEYLYYRTRPIDKNKYGTSKTEKVPGWNTNSATRPLLLDDLNEALEEGYMKPNDPIFLAECKTFVDNGGRYEADKGQHDDSIIAWGIAWQARKQPKKSYIIV